MIARKLPAEQAVFKFNKFASPTTEPDCVRNVFCADECANVTCKWEVLKYFMKVYIYIYIYTLESCNCQECCQCCYEMHSFWKKNTWPYYTLHDKIAQHLFKVFPYNISKQTLKYGTLCVVQCKFYWLKITIFNIAAAWLENEDMFFDA